MNKYAAGDHFYNKLNEHPNDFIVGKSEAREYRTYRITHSKSGIAIRFEHYDVSGNIKVVANAKDDINHVSGPTLKFLLDWAEARLVQDKINREIAEDNTAIQKLLSHY